MKLHTKRNVASPKYLWFSSTKFQKNSKKAALCPIPFFPDENVYTWPNLIAWDTSQKICMLLPPGTKAESNNGVEKASGRPQIISFTLLWCSALLIRGINFSQTFTLN